ncbi:MAG: radical SAM protein [Bacteroidia bacterium]|nr:radical SAM protein [Bacteroidia bacterium]
MNPNNIYIFNPAYILKNDVTRIIITNEKGKFYSDLVEVDITDSFLNFIHPIHAILLSYFDGINSYGEIVNTCSDLFDLSKNEITEIIDKFILNKDELKIFFNDFLFCFPKNILIPFQSKFNQRNFNFNDYKINYEYQNYNEIRLNKPIDAILMINNQCVTDCIYCYADRNKTMPCKIPFSRLKELIIEAKQLGMRNFDINGGELFLYENWYELLKLFYENCFDPFISTKIPITEKQILKLKELKVKGVQISIDSINEIELAQNVKKDVSYKNSIINTLQLLEKHEISFYTNTVITKYNSSLNTIKNLVEFLLQFKHIKRISLTAAGYSLYKTEVEYLNNKPQLEEMITIKTYI